MLFFRFPGPGVVCRQSRVPTEFPWAGAHLVWRHHTHIEAPAPLEWRVQSTVGVASAA